MCGFTYTYNHVLLYFFVYVCVYGCSWKYREGGSNNDDQFTEPKVFLKGFIYLCTSVANEVTPRKETLSSRVTLLRRYKNQNKLLSEIQFHFQKFHVHF